MDSALFVTVQELNIVTHTTCVVTATCHHVLALIVIILLCLQPNSNIFWNLHTAELTITLDVLQHNYCIF